MARWHEQLALVHACDYRGPQAQCGCNETHVCWLGAGGKGRVPDGAGYGEATLRECLECVGAVPNRDETQQSQGPNAESLVPHRSLSN